MKEEAEGRQDGAETRRNGEKEKEEGVVQPGRVRYKLVAVSFIAVTDSCLHGLAWVCPTGFLIFRGDPVRR